MQIIIITLQVFLYLQFTFVIRDIPEFEKLTEKTGGQLVKIK